MQKVELDLEDDELKELLLGDRDKAMQSIMAKILDEILKSEATEQIKAKAYERSDERTNSRNGYRVRQLTTRVGSLELHVPKLRHGNFSTQLFKRYQRSGPRIKKDHMTMNEISKNLGIGASTLHKWIKLFTETGEFGRGSGNFASDKDKEIARLKRQLRDAEGAIEVLKKSIGILSK